MLERDGRLVALAQQGSEVPTGHDSAVLASRCDGVLLPPLPPLKGVFTN